MPRNRDERSRESGVTVRSRSRIRGLSTRVRVRVMLPFRALDQAPVRVGEGEGPVFRVKVTATVMGMGS